VDYAESCQGTATAGLGTHFRTSSAATFQHSTV